MGCRFYGSRLNLLENKYQWDAQQTDDSEQPEIIDERRQLRLLFKNSVDD